MTGNEKIDRRCLHHLIESSAKATPEAIAVVYEDRQRNVINRNSRCVRIQSSHQGSTSRST